MLSQGKHLRGYWTFLWDMMRGETNIKERRWMLKIFVDRCPYIFTTEGCEALKEFCGFKYRWLDIFWYQKQKTKQNLKAQTAFCEWIWV